MASQPGTVRKLPRAWWGLFVAFRSGHKHHVAAECWWRDATMSQYGELPVWETLLKSLVTSEPLVVDNKLLFVPTFFILAEDFQKYLLSFLIHHISELPMAPTQQFLADIDQSLQYTSQSWVVSQFKLLKYKWSNLNSERPLPGISASHDFAKENQPELNSLLTLLTSRKPNPLFPAAFSDTDQQSTDSNKSTNEKVLLSSPNQNFTSPPVCEDTEIIDLTIDEDLNQDCTTIEDSMEVYEEETDTNVQQKSENHRSTEEPISTANDCKLPPEIQTQVSQLKYVWHQAEGLQEIPPEMSLFVKCSSEQVQLICDMLDFESLPEPAFATVCKHLARIGNEISYANCLHLAETCVLPKFNTQSKQISRVLAVALLTFSQQFPKPFVDGVLIPCALAQKLDLPQAELVNRVNKEVFSTNTKLYFLQQLAKGCPIIGVGMVTLLENLLDGKLELTTELLTQLVLWLEKATTLEQHSNTKYGRFVLTFVNKHKRQLTEEQVASIRRMMEGHKTFMKKAVFNALKGLPL